jgi:hypothetical protein
MSKYRKYIIVLISIYQIMASLLAIHTLAMSLITKSLLESISNLIFLSPIFIFSLLSSLALLLYINDFRKVLIFTYINQGVQIFQFKFLGSGFYIVFGTHLNFGYLNNYEPEFLFDFELFTTFAHFDINTGIEGTMFTINIIPILIILLLRYIAKANSDKSE